jgi:hypothetical protein
VTTYIVLLTTSGAASWPLLTPSEKLNCSRRLPTFSGRISFIAE